MIEDFKSTFNEEEFKKELNEFYEKHPDCPLAEPVPVLNLIMRREFAEAIIRGEKTVEFRAMSNHYCDRLYDKAVMDYMDANKDDDEVTMAAYYYFSPLRAVETIHFHNYNNSWYLDVSVSSNEVIEVSPEDVKFLQDEFGCHELDDELKQLEKAKAKHRPSYFYFAIDKVLDTNLKV